MGSVAVLRARQLEAPDSYSHLNRVSSFYCLSIMSIRQNHAFLEVGLQTWNGIPPRMASHQEWPPTVLLELCLYSGPSLLRSCLTLQLLICRSSDFEQFS